MYEKGNENSEELESPFPSDQSTAETNFDEEKIRKQLEKIIPKKDYPLIDHIINDKQNYYHNSLKNEVGVFRGNKGNLLQVVHGDENGIKIPKYIVDIGFKDGVSIMAHNHTNGLIIPSQKDIASILLYQSNYNPAYSPNKTGLLVNINVSKNKENWEKIFNKYDKFIKDKELQIQKLYLDEIKKIKNNYTCKDLNKKLDDDIHRPYFVKNQVNIVKEINNMFKENNFELKLYIL